MLGGNHHDALGISSGEVRSTLCADGGTGSSSTPPHSLLGITLHKLPMEVDPQSFLEMFKLTAVACGWPAAEWTVRLLPLMSGEAQTAALCLPASAQGSFQAVKKAVLDQIGFSPEDHRRPPSSAPPLRPALILPMLPLHPRFQPLRVLLSTRRGFLKRQGRSAGAAGGHFLPAHRGHIQGSSKDSRGYTSGNGGFGLYVVYSPREPDSTQGFGGGILGGY